MDQETICLCHKSSMALHCILIVFKWIKKQFVSVTGEDVQVVYIVYIVYIELRNNLSLSQVKYGIALHTYCL